MPPVMIVVCNNTAVSEVVYRWIAGDEIETATGQIRLKVKPTPKIRPDTVQLPEGWEEANANELTSFDGADPISGFPNLKSLRCRIKRI